MPESETRESRLRKLIIKNANGGLSGIEELREIVSLIENPIYSDEPCNRCGRDCNSEKPIYNIGMCQKYLRLAFVKRKNPFEEDSQQNNY
jgi:hypothetical protein